MGSAVELDGDRGLSTKRHKGTAPDPFPLLVRCVGGVVLWELAWLSRIFKEAPKGHVERSALLTREFRLGGSHSRVVPT